MKRYSTWPLKGLQANQNWVTATDLLEWLKVRMWQHQMLARVWNNKVPNSLLMRMENGIAVLEDSLLQN
jgi:hypothetical protein